MSNVAIRAEHPVEATSHHAHGGHGEHAEHGHHGPAHLHHHFTDVAQQRESNALAMWVFLVTEVMTFGALFFVYTLYRHLFEVQAAQMGPEWASPFAAGSHLFWNELGFFNTLVLLCSSLTVAAAVHAAGQRNKGNLLKLLVVTWILGAVFLGVKSVEWTTDWKEGLVPGLNWNPRVALAHKGYVLAEPTGVNGQAYAPGDGKAILEQTLANAEAGHGAAAGAHGAAESHGAATAGHGEAAGHGAAAGGHHAFKGFVNGMQMQLFFVIYFCMTGLHAIHMIIGLGLLAVYIVHAKNGIFTMPGNDQPVEIFGLYWHFVDIVWIFLYPLLYLIAH